MCLPEGSACLHRNNKSPCTAASTLNDTLPSDDFTHFNSNRRCEPPPLPPPEEEEEEEEVLSSWEEDGGAAVATSLPHLKSCT